MLIHVDFEINKLRNINCKVSAFFVSATGEYLKDSNNTYRNAKGYVSVGQDFVPAFDETVFSDFVLFIPFNELDKAAGKYDLKFYIKLYDERTRLAQSDYVNFEYTYTDTYVSLFSNSRLHIQESKPK